MRDFRVTGQEFESAPELLTIQRLRRDLFVVRDDPAKFMSSAITPQQTPDFPDVSLRTAVRTCADGPSAGQRERNDVVSVSGHCCVVICVRMVKLASWRHRRCDPALTIGRRQDVYGGNETCAAKPEPLLLR